MQFLWKWVDELVGKGLEMSVITELFSYAMLSMVPLALPMAVLLSSLMTFGGLAEHYELASLKSAGLSLMRIMRPLIIFCSLITIGAFFFSNYLLPYTNLKMLSTLFDIRQQKPALNIKEGVFYNEIDGYSIRIRKIQKDGQNLEDIMIYDHTDQAGNTNLTVAEQGKMYMTPDKRYLVIELKNGCSYEDIWKERESSITHPFVRMNFKNEVIRMDLSGFQMQRTDQDLFKENDKMLNGEQLQAYIDTVSWEIEKDRSQFYDGLTNAYLSRTKKYWNRIDSLKTPVKEGDFLAGFSPVERAKVYEVALNNARNCKQTADSKKEEIEGEEHAVLRYKIEFWRKYSLSLACLIMFFIGAPLGAIIRKGGMGLSVVVSVIFFIIFWVLAIIGEKLSKEGVVPPEFGMWIGCLVYLPLGIWLTIKATADSALFDLESYKQTFRNLFRFRQKDKATHAPHANERNTSGKTTDSSGHD
jgi:lipopolysaccharide export system permease protein